MEADTMGPIIRTAGEYDPPLPTILEQPFDFPDTDQEHDRMFREAMQDSGLTGRDGGHQSWCGGDAEDSPPPEMAPWTSINEPSSQVQGETIPETTDPRETTSYDDAPAPKKRRLNNRNAGTSLKSELSREQKIQMSLHERSKAFRPPAELAPTRYWIGVVVPDVKMGTVRKEGDLIWMKGHRGTTVKTVWHMFKDQAALGEDFKLMINGETPDMTTVMAELDLYNDRQVVFRPVEQMVID